jgi:hypothetical protein
MKRILIASAVMLCIAVPAMAQTSGSASTATVTNSSQSGSAANVYGNPIGNGASSSISGANAGSLSRSNSSAQSGVATARTGSSSARTGSSSATVSVYTGVSGGSGSGSDPSGDPSGSSGGGDPTINYSGGYTVHNTPEVIAPSIIGGNPCSVGVSAGVAVAGFGLTGGGTWADRACERRQEAALLYNIGQQQAAVALLCQDEHVRDAMYSVGHACQPTLRPVAVAAPPASVRAVAAAAPVPQPVARAAYAPPARPDWCDTVSGAREQARFRAECRWFPKGAALARPNHSTGRVAWNDR